MRDVYIPWLTAYNGLFTLAPRHRVYLVEATSAHLLTGAPYLLPTVRDQLNSAPVGR